MRKLLGYLLESFLLNDTGKLFKLTILLLRDG